MFVTSAHCTYLCKSGSNLVDNCCCDNVGGYDCSGDTARCGSAPTVVEMSGTSLPLAISNRVKYEFKDLMLR